MSKKIVHAPGYVGEDRRQNAGQRAGDRIADHLKLIATALGIALIIFSMGGGWVAAKMSLDNKVDRAEFEKKNGQQDKANDLVAARQDRYEQIILNEIIPKLEKIDKRVTAMYCDNKPPGCQ